MEHWSVLVFGILGLVYLVKTEVESKYDNYTLVRLFPTNDNQLRAISEFEVPYTEIEVLKRSRAHNDSFDILLPGGRLKIIQKFANDANISLEMTENYGLAFESPERTPKRRVLRSNIFAYHSFSSINNILEELARSHSKIMSLQDVGTSYQGRKMKLAKISTSQSAGNPIIFIDAGIHAREWVAPAMALYLVHRLTTDSEARKTDLDGVDWYILPCVNPDGYEYSRSGKENRMWRKTRSQHAPNCYGVDGNRNYGFKWAVSGVSHNPCDRETYAGPAPFSEKETKIVRNIMTEYSNRIKLYVSLHSYGQYLVYPWGFTESPLPTEWKKLHKLAKSVSHAIEAAGGKPFNVMSAGQWYAAAGGSDDFAFGAIGVPYSYTMELTDGYEFIYPEVLLRTVLPQFYEGFRVFGRTIRREFGGSRSKRAAVSMLRSHKAHSGRVDELDEQ